MSTETATPPAAPTAPATPVTPVTPPIPAAQKPSATPAPAPKSAQAPTKRPNEIPPESLAANLDKLAQDTFKKKEAAPAAVVVPPVTEVKPAPEAVAAAPVAPVEADPFGHIAAPEGMSEKSMTGWKALKKEAAEKVTAAERKAAEALAKLEQASKAAPHDVAEVERTKTELKEMRDKLAVLDLQSHPDFNRQFVEPKRKALTEAKTLLEANGVENLPDFTALMTKSQKEFSTTVSELAAKMPAYDQGAFVASMREAYRLQGEEKGALSKAGELKAQLEAKSAAAARNAYDEVRTNVTAKVPQIEVPANATPEKIAEVSAYNKAREAAIAEAERFSFGKASEKEVAEVSFRAAMLKPLAEHIIPSLQREVKARDSHIAALTAELEAIRGAKNPGKVAGATPPAEMDTSKMSFQELEKHVFKGKR